VNTRTNNNRKPETRKPEYKKPENKKPENKKPENKKPENKKPEKWPRNGRRRSHAQPPLGREPISTCECCFPEQRRGGRAL
jgi:hypothetical protein